MRIKLSSEQYAESRRVFLRTRYVTDQLVDLYEQIAERAARDQEEAWNQLAKIAGYECFADVWRDGKKLTVEWISGELVVEDLKTEANTGARTDDRERSQKGGD